MEEKREYNKALKEIKDNISSRPLLIESGGIKSQWITCYNFIASPKEMKRVLAIYEKLVRDGIPSRKM